MRTTYLEIDKIGYRMHNSLKKDNLIFQLCEGYKFNN